VGLAVIQNRPGRWIGHVDEIPGYAELEQPGMLVKVPVRQCRCGLGAVLKPTTVICPGWIERSIPAKAGSVGRNGQGLEACVGPIPRDDRASLKAPEIIAAHRIDPGIVSIVVRYHPD
jgi:hypothetical protein